MNTKNNFYRLLILSIVSGILFSCKTKPADESVVRDTKYKQSIIDAYKKVGMFCTLNYVPGLSVAVSIDNKVVFADGFGYSNVELKIKSSPSNLYRVGQISEIITALTAAKLSDEGKLNLDKPVSEMFPDLSKNEAKYSLYQLGVHSSGIREPLAEAGKGKENTYETLIPSFINDPLVFGPGQSVLHTELGYDLLGYLIQKSANEPFYKVVKRTVVDNLHLTGTVADNPYIIFDHKSSQYNYDFVAQPIVAQWVDLRGKEASAGYLSSVLDLVKMGNALLSPGFLKKETLDRLTIPYQLSDGRVSPLAFGLLVNKDMEGHTFWGQKGTVSGGTSTILIYPDDKLVVAIAANIGNSTWELPVFDVASAFQKQLHPEWEAKAKQEQAKQEEAQKKIPQQKETK
jgi:CubicO group peptidase (beta-lactamase class C family)